MIARRSLAAGLSAVAALCIVPASGKSAGPTPSGNRPMLVADSGAGGNAASPASTSTAGPSGPGSQIVIQRQPLSLRSPERYQVSMQLEPIRSIRLAAPFDGKVKSLLHKPGDKLQSGAEAARLDTTEHQLLVDRAKALYRAAQIQSQHPAATGAGSVSSELAEAQLQAAKADLDLAVYRAEQGGIRVPFDAEVFRVDVSEGQVVRLGETLMSVGDTTTLKAEIPVDRNAATVGQSVPVKVEGKTVPAKVATILPLAARFEPLRDILPSAGSAIVLFPNAVGTLKAGQTVFSPLVPRDPIAEVPNSCIGNVPDGTHKVQVIRGNTVRDVRITTLAPVGADRSFISGAFDPRDEVILSASQELADGTMIRPQSAPSLPPEAAGQGTVGRAKPPTAPGATPPPTRSGL